MLAVGHARRRGPHALQGRGLRYERGEWTQLDSVGGFVNALLRDRAGRLWVGQESRGLMRIDPDGRRTVYGRQQGLPGLALTPDFPYEAYAVSCVLAENDSAFRNVVNLAIARLLQGYLDGQPDTVTAVNRWLGPASALGLPESAIRASFEAALLGVETIRPVLEGQAATTGR